MCLMTVSAFAQATRTWVSGVGDDVNPCSRTAPCKTWAGAISKTASGGIIDALDPGGFGAVTITKPMTLEGNGTLASTLSSGVNGIIVNITSGSNRNVVLRNILIDGSGTTLGTNGIRFLAGDSLLVEDCYIKAYSGAGIDFEPNSAAKLQVHRTSITLCAQGILSKPSVGGSANIAVDKSLVTKNVDGIRGEGGTGGVIDDSEVSFNTGSGVIAVPVSGSSTLVLSRVHVTFNGVGITSNSAAANVGLADTYVIGNNTGMSSIGGGVLTTFTNTNKVGFNGVAGSAFNASSPVS